MTALFVINPVAENRQLRTILFADIAGYISLMRRDESEAMKMLDRFRKTIEVQAKEHDGQIVQYYGDGSLLSFDSSTAGALESKRDSMFISPSYMIRFYAQLIPDREKFINCLEEMYEIGDPDLPYMGIKGAAPFQDDPRYVRIMEDIGLW